MGLSCSLVLHLISILNNQIPSKYLIIAEKSCRDLENPVIATLIITLVFTQYINFINKHASSQAHA